MIRRVLMGAAALSLVASSAAHAVEAPRAGQADARMRTADYDPTQVVRVVGAFRTATQIVLSEGETVSHVALGDSSAWDVAADRNILFIKPKEAHGATNLIVTTSRGPETRSYTFELTTPEPRKGKRTAATYYQLRFRYPADERAQVAAVISAEEAALRQKVTQFKLDRGVLEGRRNLAYTLQGSQALQPSEVSDNGRFTVLRFPAAQPIPSIYTLTPDGSETLVPFDVRGEFVVIHSVNRQLRLRRGREVLAIWNDAFSPYGVNPGTNTAATDVDRTDKGVGTAGGQL